VQSPRPASNGMNIEELTKSQIFLLTVLTSFVTSMATGIITVALMDQAPTTITQSVSRVIQASVREPAPDKNSQPVAAAVAVPLQTPPAAPEKEPNLSEIVQRTLPSIVRLYDAGASGTFTGLGIVLDAEGTIVADAEALGGRQSVNAILADGTTLKIFAFARDEKHSLAFLDGVSASSTQPRYIPAALRTEESAIGQTIVGIFGKQSFRIASGLVVAPPEDDAPIMKTDISAALIERGTPLIDRDGALAGISTAASRAVEASAFITASAIAAQYEAALLEKRN